MKTPSEIIALNPVARREVERLVLKCGVHANLKGYSRLIDAVLLYSSTSYTLGELYRAIAEMHAIKPKTVIREISYALKQSHHIEKRLSEIIGSTFSSHEIHCGLVIAELAALLHSRAASCTV